MSRAANGPDLGWAAEVERARRYRYFQRLDFTEPPGDVEKTFKNFLLKEPLGGNKSD